MYQTSARFRELMAQPSRTLTAKGIITYADNITQEITAEHISSVNVVEDAGQHLPLGGVSASTISIALDNRAGEWNHGGELLGEKSLDGAILSVKIGVLNPEYSPPENTAEGGYPDSVYTAYYDGGEPSTAYTETLDGGGPDDYKPEYFWSDIGVFTVENTAGQEQQTLITLKGADALANKAMVPFIDALTYPTTIGGILESACLQADIPLKTSVFTNSTVVIGAAPVWGEVTCRDIIGYVACCAAGFARIGRHGMLEIVTMRPRVERDIDQALEAVFELVDGDLTVTIPDDYTGPVFSIVDGDLVVDREGFGEIIDGDLYITAFYDGENYYCSPSRYKTLDRQGSIFGPLNSLTVREYGAPNGYGATRIAVDLDIEDNELNSIGIHGNPLLGYDTAWKDTIMASVLSELSGLSFTGGTLSWQGDPTLTAGDNLTVFDIKGNKLVMLVLNQTLIFGNGFGMVSGNKLNSKVQGAAKTAYMRVFTPTGKLNATALEGDINIKAGENLNLMADSDVNVNAGANVNVNAGANVKVKAGGSLKLEADADMDITGASVNIQTDEFGIKNANGESLLGISSPSGGDPGGQMVLGSEKMPIKIGGNFVLPVENGGTGISGQTNKTHYFASYPNDLIGVDGDLGVLVNMASGVYSAITPAHHTAVTGVAVFCGMSRNWNAINPGGWTAAGNANAAGSANLYASAWSFMFSDPDTMGRISINFEAGKFIGGEWYGWSVSSYLTIAIANAAGVILGSTTFVPPVNQSAFSVNIEAALEDDTTYYILIYDNTTSANKSKALINVASVTSPAYSAGGYNCGLFVKHGGNWTLLASGSG